MEGEKNGPRRRGKRFTVDGWQAAQAAAVAASKNWECSMNLT